MPKKTAPRRDSNGEPLPRREFQEFLRTRFDPLAADVRLLQEDVKLLQGDVKLLQGDMRVVRADVRSLRHEFMQAQKLADERHREVITGLDEIVTMFRGMQDKRVVHDVRLRDLERKDPRSDPS